MTQRELLLGRLTQLLPPQFEQLVFLLQISPAHLSGAQTERAIQIIRYLEGQSRLEDLERRLDEVAPSRPPEAASGRAPQFPSLTNIPVQTHSDSLPPLEVLRRPSQPKVTAPRRPRGLAKGVAAASIGVGLLLMAVLWPTESQVSDAPGKLTAGVVDFVMGPAWRTGPDAVGRLATDAVITSSVGKKPVLELTRVFDPQLMEAGDLGIGWRLFQTYSITTSDEIVSRGNYRLPNSVTLRNQITAAEARLTLSSQGLDGGYVGSGLAPWTGLMLTPAGGAYLSDDRGNEINFREDRLVSIVLVGDARWMLHQQNSRLVALQSIPRAIIAKRYRSDDTLEVAELDDALDPATFELQGEGPQRALRPQTTGRWEKIRLIANGACVVDRWGNEFCYKPLNKFYAFTPSNQLTPIVRSSGGIQFTYDGYGRIQVADLGSGKRVTYEYDSAGRLASVVDASGRRKAYRYSPGSIPTASVSQRTFPMRAGLVGLAVVFLGMGAWTLRRRAQPRDRD